MVKVNFLQRPYEYSLSVAGKKYGNLVEKTDSEASSSSASPPRKKHASGHDSSDRHDSELQRALVASAKLETDVQNGRAAARKRLQAVLESYNAKLRPVKADGNCQFRAISFNFYGSEDHHGEIRARVVQQLRKDPERYESFVFEPYEEYVTRIARDGQWGDNVTLQAASDAMKCVIQVITDTPAQELLTVHPAEVVEGLLRQPLWSVRQVCLAFESEMHYDAAVITRTLP